MTNTISDSAAAIANPSAANRVLAFLNERRLALGTTAAALSVSVLLLAAYYRPEIVIPVFGPIHSFQIYSWENGYTEANSAFFNSRTVYNPDQAITELRFPAPDRFRLDFVRSGIVRFGGTVTRIDRSFLRESTTVYTLAGANLFTHGMKLLPDGNYTFDINDDPYVDVPLSALKVTAVTNTDSITPFFYLVIPGLFAFAIYRGRERISNQAPLLLSMLCLILFVSFLAMTLPYNHGPDEVDHILSGRWYLNHFRPPSMADPVFYDSYWGWNYLIGSPDLTYWLTFKTAGVVDAIATLDPHLLARLSQIALCSLCFVAMFAFADITIAWTFLISLAVVPQLAYTMTYVNGDALSYALTYASLGILWRPRIRLPGVAIAVLLFVLCNTKVNYIILLPVAIYLVYLKWGRSMWPWVAVGLVAGSYKRVFNLIDERVVGRTFLQNEMLHCSAQVRNQLQTVNWHYIVQPDFYETSLKSLYGVFGYLNYFLPWYYYVAGASLALFLLAAYNWRHRAITITCFAVSLAASLYWSSTVGYQAQGRYLFPALVSVFLVAARNIDFRKYFWYAIPTATALGGFWMANFMQAG